MISRMAKGSKTLALRRMGLSRKISRIGKTKKQKEATKLIKSSSNQVQKQSSSKPKSPAKPLPVKKDQRKVKSKDSKYVTDGMVDYVTLLRSRKSGPKLRNELQTFK